jgi:hypothetical protein
MIISAIGRPAEGGHSASASIVFLAGFIGHHLPTTASTAHQPARSDAPHHCEGARLNMPLPLLQRADEVIE